ncbi:hypothetical protein AYO44_12815 [Planctomycetaceae bacterium SCGC AG-212-F19]|nr:hypothetical protein AYO44_12815 [Planctomycetaceae bacterium SCGC AG-212-F19]
MAGAQKRKRDKHFGKIEIEEEGIVSFLHRPSKTNIKASTQKWTWVPCRKVMKHLPKEFSLSFQCVTGLDGLRRIYPYLPFGAFIPWAWEGGLAVLSYHRKLRKKDRQSYRTMWFHFQFARRMREFLGNSFAYNKDLRVAKSGRSDPKEEDILPETIGLDAQGGGQRWTVGELTRRGEEAVRKTGIATSTAAQRIRYGLLEAARLNPLPIGVDKASLLVRSALFNLGPTADEIDPELIDIVGERVIEAFQNHLEDNTKQFRKWYLDPKNSLVHQIGKKSRSRGGRLDEGEVRAALLRLGWDAYRSVGDCISLQMQAVAHAFPVDFTAEERAIFKQMHLPQPYFGNLPLILVVDRFGFMQDVLWEIWQGIPPTEVVPVLHRVLDYYAEMATKRREVDRAMKRPKAWSFDENLNSCQQENNKSREVFEHLREREKITCKCRAPDWQYDLKKSDKSSATIVFQCRRCEVRKERKFKINDVKEAVVLLMDKP